MMTKWLSKEEFKKMFPERKGLISGAVGDGIADDAEAVKKWNESPTKLKEKE